MLICLSLSHALSENRQENLPYSAPVAALPNLCHQLLKTFFAQLFIYFLEGPFILCHIAPRLTLEYCKILLFAVRIPVNEKLSISSKDPCTAVSHKDFQDLRSQNKDH